MNFRSRTGAWVLCALVVPAAVAGACDSSDDHRARDYSSGGDGAGDANGGAGGDAVGGERAVAPGSGGADAGAGNAAGGTTAGGVATSGEAGQTGSDDPGGAGAGSTMNPFPTNVTSRAATWSVRFGGPGQQQAQAIAAPATGGGVVVVGQMDGTLVTSKKTLISAGSYDAFAIKLDENGSVLWALSFGDSADQRATAVAIDASGNVFIGGFSQPSSTLNFGTGTQTGGTMFIVEVNSGGTYLRGGVVPSDGNTRLKGLTIGPSDTLLYVADVPPGATLTAGCLSPYTTQFSNMGTSNSVAAVELSSTFQCLQDMSVSAEGSLGIVYPLNDKLLLPAHQPAVGQVPGWISVTEYPFAQWSMSSTLRDSIKPEGADAQVNEFVSATDGAGGLVFGGSYFGKAHVNVSSDLPSEADGDAPFAAKADKTGALQWLRSYGSQATGHVSSVAALTNFGHSFIAGHAQGIVDFGAGPVLPIGKDVPFDNTFFVACLGGNGDAVWATRFALGASFPGIAVASVLDDSAYVTGVLNGSTNLGTGVLASAGDDDVFVAKFAP